MSAQEERHSAGLMTTGTARYRRKKYLPIKWNLKLLSILKEHIGGGVNEDPRYRPQWMIVLTSVVVAGISVASGETFAAFFAEPHPARKPDVVCLGVPALRSIVDSQE